MTADSRRSTPEKSEDGEVEETVGAALDQDFYLRCHPELASEGVDPVKHYLAHGHDAGLDPTPDFDTGFYLSRSPDVVEADMNGFFHYLRWGKVEGRAPNPGAIEAATRPTSAAERLVAPHVDPQFYRASNPGAARTHIDPAKHYLHFGWHAGLDPSAAFSTTFYRASGYETDRHENPLHHYLREGRRRGRLPRPLLDGADMHAGPAVEAALRPHFDADFYRAAYPEAASPGVEPLVHYIERGWREGRDPAPWFSTAQYVARFPDVEAVGANPFLHWVLWGRSQGFPPALGPGDALISAPSSEAGLVSAELRPMALSAREPEPGAAPLDPSRLDIHWIIPDVEAPGRGGHMTVFRVVRWLEAFGHRCTVWINDPHPAWSDEGRRDLIQRSYQAIAAEVRVLAADTQFPPEAVVVATSWTTALVLNATRSARHRFYFVQDDEREFHPAGAKALAAERTYRLEMGYICAGPWLAEMLAGEHGRWVRAFDLAPEERLRAPTARALNDPPRIAFYARSHTERRAVELGLLALERLAERGVRFEAHLFGSETPVEEAPFPTVNHGVLDSARLADLYGACDIGLCFSATNYSLIPQEMMACGLPVVELDGPGGQAVFPPGVATLAAPEPEGVASALSRLLSDPDLRQQQTLRALDWVARQSWEASTRAVEAAMVERLQAQGALLQAEPRPQTPAPIASVLIPTLNGGAGFRSVLETVLAQRAPWSFEVVVVDSESDDGTWEWLQERSAVRSLRIPRAEFQHGRTRNLLAAEASGEFLAYLTQDAEPASRLWLGDLVGTLQRHPRAAGAFGRHLPRPDASPFTKRDLHGFFEHLGGQPLERSKFNDLERWRSGDPTCRRDLHFFSSNNSCLRRSVWERHPLPEVEYGEDQLWAAGVLAQRYSLVYAPTASVIHSHEYDEASRYERSRVEGRWFREAFGYDMLAEDAQTLIARMNAGDERWGVRNRVPAETIAAKKRLNRAEIEGLAAGQRES